MSAPDISQWIGRSRTERDIASIAPMRGVASLLDRDPAQVKEGQLIPPSACWLYFLPFVRQSEIDRDGHPRRGGFLPPVDLPRRMWAGSTLEMGEPIRIGEAIERKSTILEVIQKSGRSGRLAFVAIQHEVSGPRGLAVRERQDIVYREPPQEGSAAQSAPSEEIPSFELNRTFEPDPVKLFRFSALTFNAHRIHYDRDYARQEEGYRDLVVHGPFLATLLLELAQEAAGTRRISRFTWRGKRPAFADTSLRLGTRWDGPDELQLLAVGPDGVAMEARAKTVAAAT